MQNFKYLNLILLFQIHSPLLWIIWNLISWLTLSVFSYPTPHIPCENAEIELTKPENPIVAFTPDHPILLENPTALIIDKELINEDEIRPIINSSELEGLESSLLVEEQDIILNNILENKELIEESIPLVIDPTLPALAVPEKTLLTVEKPILEESLITIEDPIESIVIDKYEDELIPSKDISMDNSKPIEILHESNLPITVELPILDTVENLVDGGFVNVVHKESMPNMFDITGEPYVIPAPPELPEFMDTIVPEDPSLVIKEESIQPFLIDDNIDTAIPCNKNEFMGSIVIPPSHTFPAFMHPEGSSFYTDEKLIEPVEFVEMPIPNEAIPSIIESLLLPYISELTDLNSAEIPLIITKKKSVDTIVINFIKSIVIPTVPHYLLSEISPVILENPVNIDSTVFV